MNKPAVPESFSTFLSDPDVQYLMANANKEHNIFNILEPGETGHSKMIAWLLNPRESHMGGDFFIKQLLLKAIDVPNKYKSFNQKIDFVKNWTSEEITYIDFNASIVIKEFKLPDSDRRIDIALFDPNNHVMVFIENKRYSQEGKDQTPDYLASLRTIAEELDWYALFIFMDFRGKEADEKTGWVSLDYEWLIRAMQNYLDNNAVINDAHNIVSSYCNKLAQDYDDDTLQESKAAINSRYNRVADVYKDVVNYVKNNLYSRNMLKSEVIENKWINDKTDENKEGDNQSAYISYIYWQNYRFFDALIGLTEWDHKGEKVLRLLANPKAYELVPGDDGVWFIHKDWKDLFENEDWGINVSIRRYDESENQLFLNLYIKAGKLLNNSNYKSFLDALVPDNSLRKGAAQILRIPFDETDDAIYQETKLLLNKIDNHIHLLK